MLDVECSVLSLQWDMPLVISMMLAEALAAVLKHVSTLPYSRELTATRCRLSAQVTTLLDAGNAAIHTTRRCGMLVAQGRRRFEGILKFRSPHGSLCNKHNATCSTLVLNAAPVGPAACLHLKLKHSPGPEAPEQGAALAAAARELAGALRDEGLRAARSRRAGRQQQWRPARQESGSCAGPAAAAAAAASHAGT
jgi:hypothetical protein